jgi:stage IV sporulation protein FB
VRIARIRGIDILLSPAVVVLAVAAVCYGHLAGVLLLSAAVFFHEAAHSVTATFLGYRLEEVRLYPLGGSVRIGGMSGLDPLRETLIALAGPAANVFLAIVTLLFSGLGLVPRQQAGYFIAINTVIFLFNLLPALPLDGGRVLRGILSCKYGIVGATKAVCFIGRIIAVLMFLFALSRGLQNPFEISMAAAAVFLYLAGAGERKMAASLMVSQVGSKEGLLQKKGFLRSKTFVAAYNASGKRVMGRFAPGYYHIVYVVGKNGEVLGKVSEQQVFNAIMRSGFNVRMEEIIKMHNP